MPNKNEAFSYQPGSRPNGTSLVGDRVVHYTCNAPRDKVLRRYGIVPVGSLFGVAPREVLDMPLPLFTRRGYRPEQVGTIEAEQVLRSL